MYKLVSLNEKKDPYQLVQRKLQRCYSKVTWTPYIPNPSGADHNLGFALPRKCSSLTTDPNIDVPYFRHTERYIFFFFYFYVLFQHICASLSLNECDCKYVCIYQCFSVLQPGYIRVQQQCVSHHHIRTNIHVIC